MLRTNRGLISMLDYNTGFGVGDGNGPYSKSFNGFNLLLGYQINRSFIIAGGTGISVYNGGSLIPVFIDLRYTFWFSTLAPYIYADEGLLVNTSDFDQTVVFINPGIGARYSLTPQLAVNMATGIFVQSGTRAASGSMSQSVFINLKAGITYKFRRKTNGYRIKQTG